MADDSRAGRDPIIPVDFEPGGGAGRRGGFRLRGVHAAAAAFLAVSAAAGWFVLTARSLSVVADPPGARVDIDGGVHVRLAGRYLIRPGEYRIALSHPGYRDLAAPLTVGPEPAQTSTHILRRLPGIVSVLTPGLAGARVLIDGTEAGRTPLAGAEVEAGLHRLVVSLDRHLDHVGTIEVEGRSAEQTFEVALERAWAVATLSTDPPGARVLVDGEPRGFTPLAAEILAGRREIALEMPGRKSWRAGFDVAAGEDFAVPPVALEPADGLVSVRSEPPGAGVTAAGAFLGLTPLEAALPSGRDHELAFFLQGYRRAAATVRLRPEQRRELTVELEPVLVSVSVRAEPPDAELYVNGEYRGPADQTVELMAASQRIEIRKEGYVPYSVEFTSRPGLDQAIRPRLKTLEQARRERLPSEIATAAGQTLKLFEPGPFTMGASRREPGRRANEALRAVRLERLFYFGLREVSNAEYRLFDPSHSSGVVQGATLDNAAQPVANVGWLQAARYCNWLSGREGLAPFYRIADDRLEGFDPASTGYRLPSEAEWAWVARAGAGDAPLRYPWGRDMPPPEGAGNFADAAARAYAGQVVPDYNDRHFAAAPTGAFAPNHHGVFDLAGNVAEWVHDHYGAVGAAETDPLGPPTGQFHVIRGSSWLHGGVTELRLSFRDFGSEPRDDLGFRIARYADGPGGEDR